MPTGPESILVKLPPALSGRVARVAERLRSLGRVAVALSGGVDSATLLALARTALGAERVGAFLAVSPSLAPPERRAARAVARCLGVTLAEIPTAEHRDPRYRANSPDRCYFCKRHVFGALGKAAREAGFTVLVEGTLAEDLAGHRPGYRAARELGVVSPFVEAGFRKEDVRALARTLQVPVAEKPAQPCLASRIPYHRPVTEAKLAQVGAAEAWLRRRGFAVVRVRHHDEVARIEVPQEDIPKLLETPLRGRVLRALRRFGFTYVTVDLEGYSPGKLLRQAKGERWGHDGQGPDQER